MCQCIKEEISIHFEKSTHKSLARFSNAILKKLIKILNLSMYP